MDETHNDLVKLSALCLSLELGINVKKRLRKCRKICVIGCVNHACARARVMQPIPHIFLHIFLPAAELSGLRELHGFRPSASASVSSFVSSPCIVFSDYIPGKVDFPGKLTSREN